MAKKKANVNLEDYTGDTVPMYKVTPFTEYIPGVTPDVYGMKSSLTKAGHLEVAVPVDRYDSELGREHNRLLTEEEYDEFLVDNDLA